MNQPYVHTNLQVSAFSLDSSPSTSTHSVRKNLHSHIGKAVRGVRTICHDLKGTEIKCAQVMVEWLTLPPLEKRHEHIDKHAISKPILAARPESTYGDAFIRERSDSRFSGDSSDASLRSANTSHASREYSDYISRNKDLPEPPVTSPTDSSFSCSGSIPESWEALEKEVLSPDTRIAFHWDDVLDYYKFAPTRPRPPYIAPGNRI